MKHRKLRRLAPAALAAGLAWCMLAGCEQLRQARPTTRPAKTQYDDNYVAALCVADSFCQAWLQADEAIGRALLGRRMLRSYSDQQLRDAIVGAANPVHAAYEISGGRLMGDGRYAFDVRLFYRYIGGHADRLESPLERIVIAYDGGRWCVEEFPVPPFRPGVR